MQIRIQRNFDIANHMATINTQPILDNQERVDLLVSNYMLDKDFYTKALELYKIADSIYPNECDLQLETKPTLGGMKYGLALIIHFPKLTVSNSKNAHIDIKDVFFKIELVYSNRKVILGYMMGQRTTFTYAEYSSGYRFSHMSSWSFNNPPQFLGFCFGDGDIPILETQFNQTPESDKIRLNIFTMIIIAIQNYLSWESLEGGPYQKMETIGNMTTIWNPQSMSISEIDMYADDILQEKSFIDCDIFFKDNVCKIADNDKFDSSMTYIVEKKRIRSNNIFYKKSANGDLYLLNSTKLTVNVTKIPILFKQKLYYYTVENIDAVLENSNIYINPLIKNNVRNKLEFSINSKIIGSSLTQRLYDQSEAE